MCSSILERHAAGYLVTDPDIGIDLFILRYEQLGVACAARDLPAIDASIESLRRDLSTCAPDGDLWAGDLNAELPYRSDEDRLPLLVARRNELRASKVRPDQLELIDFAVDGAERGVRLDKHLTHFELAD
jgi:hypothetical protein